MKKAIYFATLISAMAMSASAAQAGACYRKVSTGPVYDTITKRVLVQPARTHFEKIPALYRTVTKTVLVSPARRIAHTVPCLTRIVTERVMVSPPTKVWTVKRDWRGREIGCWVKRPAVYATRRRAVIVRPASVRYSVIPAAYRTVSHQVVVRPARVVQHTTPPVYGTRSYRRLVSHGSTSWQPINYCQ